VADVSVKPHHPAPSAVISLAVSEIENGPAPTDAAHEPMAKHDHRRESSSAHDPGLRPPERGRALVLSGEIGAGHPSTAEALSNVLGEGWRTTTIDSMALLGSRGAAAGEAVFRRLLDMPGVYDAFHFSSLRQGTALARAADRAARKRILPRLAGTVAAQQPDVIVAVFATGASAAAELARAGQAPPVIAFCTDVAPHWMWVHDGIEAYLVICPAAAEAVRRYRPHANVVVVPRPVRSGFLRPPDQSTARAALGVAQDDRCVLLMSGGWGLGPVAGAAASLADAGLGVLAVAGSNRALHTRLRQLSRSRPRMHAFGYTTEIPALMAASDLVITTSGLTCSEARAVGRHLLLIDVVPGHGRENLQHELELGNASVASADPAALRECALAAVDRAVIATPQDPTADFTGGLAKAFAEAGLSDDVVA
jgi:processive 1,2-diacylglycerol beta-glucosyltransferase